MKDWRPLDFIVLMLAATVSFVVISVALEAFYTDKELTTEQSTNYAGLLGSLLSMISMYIGSEIRKKLDKN